MYLLKVSLLCLVRSYVHQSLGIEILYGKNSEASILPTYALLLLMPRLNLGAGVYYLLKGVRGDDDVYVV